MKILFFANTDWYLYNFRLALAKSLRDMGYEVVLVSPPGEYVNKIKDEGFKWLCIDMNRRSINPFSEVLSIYKLTKIYKSEKPDIVHHFTIKPVVYGSLSARLAGVKSVVNAVAGLGFVFTNTAMLARVLRPLVKLILKISMNTSSSRLILQNPDDQELFIKSGLVNSDRIRLIKGSGVNVEKFKPTTNVSDRKQLNILLATRLLWDKGIREFIDAVRIIKENGCDAKFLLAGEPDEGNPASVQRHEIENWVSEGLIEHLGHISDIESILRNTDIVVLPSYREGLPRILLESASMALPLVSTDVPGCREIVKDRVNGLLVPAKNSDLLATAIQYLIANSEERVVMGLKGREMVLSEFDEKIVIDKTVNVYNEIV